MRKLLLGILLVMTGAVGASAQAPVAMQAYPGLNSVAIQTAFNLTGSPANIHNILFRPVGTVTTCTIAVDSSADGVTWSAGGAITGTSCTANGEATSTSPLEANFIRINITAFTGTGFVNVVYIARSTLLPTGGGSVTIAGSGGTSTQVQGCGPADAAAACNPVVVAGVDGSGNVQELPIADQATVQPAQVLVVGGADLSNNVRRIGVDNNGTLATSAASAGADGQSNGLAGRLYDPLFNQYDFLGVFPMLFNGATWDRAFYCNLTKFVTGVTATTTQIVAAVAGTKIRICSVIIERNDVTGVATTVKLVEGTGANCAAGQTSLTANLFTSGATAVTTDSPPVVINNGPGGAFITNVAADAVCVQTTGAASSFDVTVTFEQH
jgi:hypothetical protein